MARPARTDRLLWLAGVVALGSAALAGGQPAASFTIRADWFNRGNVRVSLPGQNYAGKYPCIWNAGKLPNQSEYDLDFPVTADYTFVGLYTAHGSRPVDIYLDGKKIHRGFAGVTGDWNTNHAKWETQCTVHVTKGKHTVKLLCPGPCMPHICALRMESPVPFPKDWRLQRTVRRPAAAVAATADLDDPTKFLCGYPYEPPDVYDYHQPFKRIPPPTPRAHRILEYTLMGKYDVQAEIVNTAAPAAAGPEANNELLEKRDGIGLESTPWVARLSVKVSEKRTEADMLALSPTHLRKMLAHTVRLVDRFRQLNGHHGQPTDVLAAERSRATKLLATVDSLIEEPDSKAKWHRFYLAYLSAYQLKNRVALSNPLLDFGKLLLAKRLTYNTSHIYTTYYDGSDRYKAGSGIVTLSPVRPDGKIANLTGELKTDAIYRDPDLDVDARRVLFSYKPDRPSPCRIYEVGIDPSTGLRAGGSGLRQLTDSVYDDVDPCYLPDGKTILFVSTRCERVTLCHNAFTVSVMHTMDRDGKNIRCISRNTVHDFRPSVQPNGQIVFTRWEYIDKHLGNQQSLWVGNPDGTRIAHVAGNHFGPLTLWEAFRVPNSRKFACILAPHMPLACGPVGLVDPMFTYASPAVYENLTPELPPATHFSWLRTDVGYYTYAWPLSEDYYLVSYCYGPADRDPTGYGIYLLDRWNNRDLVYRDPELSCFEPIPVRPRPAPPVIPARERDEKQATGEFFVTDVYQGLTGIERGEVKYLRVAEDIPKPVSAPHAGFGIQYPGISNGGHLALKRVWGTVPVEADGSAYFRVPADKAIYFVALDKDFLEVQRMRSFTSVSPGQRFGCIGCHEPKYTAPTIVDATAVRRSPSDITPPPYGGGVHAPDFYHDVQDVLDRHCAKCHTGPKPKGGIDLSPDFTNLFNVAYETLTNKKLVKYVSDYSVRSLLTRPPKYYGSHASKAIQVLRTTHKDRVKLSPLDLRRLATWIDCNAPYYGTYTYSRPRALSGRAILDHHKGALADIHKRRCQSCHAGAPDPILCRIRLPDLERSRPLLAPLAKAAGGDQSCKKAVFADKNDPDYVKLHALFAKIRSECQSNPRADMRPDRPPLLDPTCRYVYRPGQVREQ